MQGPSHIPLIMARLRPKWLNISLVLSQGSSVQRHLEAHQILQATMGRGLLCDLECFSVTKVFE